jgi:hypothetical protein
MTELFRRGEVLPEGRNVQEEERLIQWKIKVKNYDTSVWATALRAGNGERREETQKAQKFLAGRLFHPGKRGRQCVDMDFGEA